MAKLSDRMCRKCGKLELSYWQYSNDKLCDACAKEEFEKEQERERLNYPVRLLQFPPKYFDIIKNIKEQASPVFLFGNSGSGKTVKACAIGKAYAVKMKKVHFYSCPRLIVKLQRAATGKEYLGLDTYLDIICNEDVIILDDLGCEKMSDFVRQCLYMIINHREQYQKDTIITSNYSLAQIAQQIDVRISSRINGMCQAIQISGKDRRKDK